MSLQNLTLDKNMKVVPAGLWLCLLLVTVLACQPGEEAESHAYMLSLLEQTATQSAVPENIFSNETRVAYYDSLATVEPDNLNWRYQKAVALLHHGDSQQAADIFGKLLSLKQNVETQGRLDPTAAQRLEHQLALSYLRLGEQENCIVNHTSASCLFPLDPGGYHQLEDGSRRAVEIYTRILEDNPDDMEARWLLNIAYMTLGQHPEGVPAAWLIPDTAYQANAPVSAFTDIAPAIGFDIRGLSGGLVVDDFTNDGYLDILISAWGQRDQLRFFINNADGTFTEATQEANLTGLFGGLNMLQADYNNDGWLDVFIMRGAWLREYGQHPNSLLKNNGDGTFTDVTQLVGLLTFHPTQTAVWHDFNRDGRLDIFVGNESVGAQSFHKSELFINQSDDTFVDVAQTAGVTVNKIGFKPTAHYIKGVTAGDYNNDGWPDIYVSTGSLNRGQNFLYRNDGLGTDGQLHFTDVTHQAGLATPASTFTTWFFDYNNDGWQDIFAASYLRSDGQGAITEDLAAEYLGLQHDAETGFIYRNNQDGTFSDVSSSLGLNRVLYAMGANYGDYDNDGWLDFYLGTGNISLGSTMPNKLFRNQEGQNYQDVTNAARVGHLQKGHAVSFADLDHDGDQDLLMSMGGAYQGDIYQNAFFLNPYENKNHWISLDLSGRQSNCSAIGTQLVFTVNEDGQKRTIYRWVSSGGSFGASPLRVEVGLGQATTVAKIEVHWINSETQVFTDIPVDAFYQLTEGQKLQTVALNLLHFDKQHHPHVAVSNP